MGATISRLDLNNFQPLDTLTPEYLKEIAQQIEIFELKKGDVVFKAGDKGESHIFLYKGNIELIIADMV